MLALPTMEAFSLLKYWRGSGASTAHATSTLTDSSTSTNGANTIGETIRETTESDEEVHADDGPFFDMEFTVDGEERARSREFGAEFDCIHECEDESDECDCENDNDNEEAGELKFTLSSASSGDSIDPNISLSPSDDLFFKGRLVPLSEPEPDSNAKPVSKSSSTKLRVLMLKLKKSTKPRSENEQNAGVEDVKDVKYKPPEKGDVAKSSTKLFTVKFKVDDVPVLSMFSRDNSWKVSNTKTNKENVEKSSIIEEEEKVFSKDMVNKYLKPLYFRVSKRYGEKLGFSGAGTPKVRESMAQVRNVKSLKQGISLPGKLRVVRKQLGKSKSASSTVTAAADSPPLVMVAKRRDDSLLQQQDGIQSAILHCKRSFKASRELEIKQGCEGNENLTKSDLFCSADKAKV